MLQINDYVRRKGTEGPVGIVQWVFGPLLATVRWGVQDGNVFTDDVNTEDLEKVPFEVLNQEEQKDPLVHRNVFEMDEDDILARNEAHEFGHD